MIIVEENVKLETKKDLPKDFSLFNYYLKKSKSLFTAHTKTRSEVSGSTKKAYKQKGTGRARAGSSKTPLKPGGGIIFGPRYRGKVSFKLNKRDILDYKSSIIDYFSKNCVVNIVSPSDNYKVKDLKNNLSLNNTDRVLILSSNKNYSLYKSNLNNITCSRFYDLNLDLINTYKVVYIDSLLWNNLKENFNV